MVYDIIVSGHLCADLIPDTSNLPLQALANPGKLYEVDALNIATGGSVSNTGIALHTLGINVGLMTTVGDDLLGRVIIAKLKDREPKLGAMIAVRQDEASSYSIILSPENADRIILHCTGNNDHFDADDIDFDIVSQAKIFHLGYPPLLPKLYANNAESLISIFRTIYESGVLTSLDMAHPDPQGLSGQVNWNDVLQNLLPYVDIFLPSIEEVVFMMRRSDYDQWKGDILPQLTREYLHSLAQDLLEMGATIVGFKLGELGSYLSTTLDVNKLERFRKIGLDINKWQGIDTWQPAYDVQVVGTTGAGDSAYGGFLAALIRGLDADSAMRVMCAVGACNVEAHDASSGLKTWDATVSRIDAGWEASSLQLKNDLFHL